MPKTLSNQSEPEKPSWQKFCGEDGSTSYDFGGKNGPIDKKILDQFCAQVKQQYKGQPLHVKVQAFKKLIEDHDEGDTSATGLAGAGRSEGDYFANFRASIKKIPQEFAEFVPASAKQEGDRILVAAQKAGYPLESYNVAKSDYTNALREGAGSLVYHAYAANGDHGEELIRRLSKLGTAVPYEVMPLATTVVWQEGWQTDPNVKLETIGDQKFGRSMIYAIVFRPKDPREADKLVEFFKRNADPKKKDAVINSWKILDIRSTNKVSGFQKRILNIKHVSGVDILILKGEPIEGFIPSNIWLNGELAKFAKSITVLRLAPVAGRPIVYTGAANKSINMNTLAYLDSRGFLSPVKKSEPSLLQRLKVSLVVTKAFRYVAPHYRQGKPVAGYGQTGPQAQQPTEEQKDIARTMEEQKRQGKVPLMSEEVQEKKLKQRRQVNELIRLPLDEFMNALIQDFGIEPGSDKLKEAVEGWKARNRGRTIY